MDSASSTEAKEILMTAGAAIGKSPDQLESIIKKIVEENWIDTKEALSALTADQWNNLGVPLRLVNEIQNILTQKKETAAERSVRSNVVAETDLMTAVSYDVPSSQDIPLSLSVAMNMLQTLIIDEPEHCDLCFVTLLKIVDAILKNPNDATKRRLRASNATFKERVSKFESGMTFLYSIGFRLVETNVEMPIAFISRLMDGRQHLAELMKCRKLSVPPLNIEGFNPYASNIAITNPQLQSFRTPGPANDFLMARIAENVAVDEQIKQHEKLLKSMMMPYQIGTQEDIPLNPKVFLLSQIRDFPIVTETTIVEEENDEISNETSLSKLSAEEIRHLRMTLGEGPQFKSRAKLRYEELQKQRVYSKCVLRIVLPDHQTVLQLEFRPHTKIRDVNATIQTCLSKKLMKQKWRIYQSPPKRTFHPEKSLYDEKLVPAALVYLSFDGHETQPPYLSSHLLMNTPSHDSKTATASSINNNKTEYLNRSSPMTLSPRQPSSRPVGDREAILADESVTMMS